MCVLPARVPLFPVMLFGVRAVKALLRRLTAGVEVTVFSKGVFSIMQSAGWIAAILMEIFSMFGNVHEVLLSFSVNVSSGKAMRCW